ncbi:hypothetical protein PV08_06962 [Exophiala spinifera]|uniref:Alpha/beta hydrolase fold-3 domain-containing protein n=1 Tax=Exophiala spinifera TaxID=91928 RepID=A0A0D1YGR3_9EURO|nr:uncharacterized protein PV08_06962 [Exophiala spinifera]KIW14181.1 hypothetical protein PV08_06962 [Exophiala spinifera]
MSSSHFGVTWRKALVSLPRLVPDFVLHWTSPEGPHPLVFDVPSRDSHKIPLYVFIPPDHNPRHHKPASEGTHLHEALHLPRGTGDEERSLPVLIDFHGGGFVLGSCQEQVPFCAKMCRELNCVVISVDYRLGPAAQYPAAHFDAEDVTRAVLDPTKPSYRVLRASIQSALQKQKRKNIQLDEQRIAFSGFSSGGNLALNMALTTKNDPTIHTDWPSPVPWDLKNHVPLLLFYPSFDTRLLPHQRPRPEGYDAPPTFAERWRLEAELMPTYLPASKSGHPRASPGLADLRAPEGDNSGLHPKAKIMLILPQFDTLHHQSVVWIKKVNDEGRGSDLNVVEVKGVIHGWTQFPDSWLDDDSRASKWEMFEKARMFLDMYWNHPEGKEVDVVQLATNDDGDVKVDSTPDT